jgi:2-keto-3-deoxy-L-rhamnonate aldolase RhmA
MANSGYDFLWIEMQHSPLSYQDMARMIWACKLFSHRHRPVLPRLKALETDQH